MPINWDNSYEIPSSASAPLSFLNHLWKLLISKTNQENIKLVMEIKPCQKISEFYSLTPGRLLHHERQKKGFAERRRSV